MAARLRVTFCGLRGHDTLLHFERGRICLRCSNCGYESAGWRIAK
jgi:hypothetical protein